MTKLNKRKISWIMRELERGEHSIGIIAHTQKVTARRIRQLREHLQFTGKELQLKTERKFCQRVILPKEKEAVLNARKKYPCGAIKLESILKKEYRICIPHNVIQKILKIEGLAMILKNKVKRKNWVRYERKHSNSMWHVDWTQLKDGRWIIAYEDDASRFITGADIFDNATTENSLLVLKGAILKYGKPRQILSGRDVQFYCNEREGFEQGKNKFQIFLEENDIEHILGRVNHPQTNGKLERFFGTVKAKMRFFNSLKEFLVWYNDVAPHMSLNFDRLETPAQAFVRKMHHKAKENEKPLVIEVSVNEKH